MYSGMTSFTPVLQSAPCAYFSSVREQLEQTQSCGKERVARFAKPGGKYCAILQICGTPKIKKMKPKPRLVLPQVAPVIRTTRTWNVLHKSFKFIFLNLYWCQAPTRHRKFFADTQLKIAQVVTVLLVEQCLNNTVIMAEQCCPTKNVVHCSNNVVQH